MSKEEFIKCRGVISESLPGTLFKVKLENGREILCHLSGKMRINSIKLIPGDKVELEISPYDLNKGRIIFRFK